MKYVARGLRIRRCLETARSVLHGRASDAAQPARATWMPTVSAHGVRSPDRARKPLRASIRRRIGAWTAWPMPAEVRGDASAGWRRLKVQKYVGAQRADQWYFSSFQTMRQAWSISIQNKLIPFLYGPGHIGLSFHFILGFHSIVSIPSRSRWCLSGDLRPRFHSVELRWSGLPMPPAGWNLAHPARQTPVTRDMTVDP